MERCPNCRARYKEAAECHRCGMEFTSLLATAAQAKAQLALAIGCLAQGRLLAATVALEHAQTLQNQPLAAALLAFLRTRYAGQLLFPRKDSNWPLATPVETRHALSLPRLQP